ncbi:hypothetical protein chiPu_0026727, partial [Chiloscyllium punctatum]|nr:hypothetical protein [Chiloscyllium punctatum]
MEEILELGTIRPRNQTAGTRSRAAGGRAWRVVSASGPGDAAVLSDLRERPDRGGGTEMLPLRV